MTDEIIYYTASFFVFINSHFHYLFMTVAIS